MSIKENLDALYRDVPEARNARLIAVSKYAPIEKIIEAYDCGLREFGENKIQDLEKRLSDLPHEILKNTKWHFLGHLQKNKVKNAVRLNLELIQSVDSLALAEKLSQTCLELNKQQNILIQLNLTHEPQKTGYKEEELWIDFPRILALKGLMVHGLMTMAPHTQNVDEIKQCFCHLRTLRDRLHAEFSHPIPELSMGMSQDFAHAIECGATIIRIGNRLFAS